MRSAHKYARIRAQLQKHPNVITIRFMARPKKFEQQRVTKAIRISPEVNEALARLAEERQVSVNLLVSWALEQFIEAAKPVDEIKRAG